MKTYAARTRAVTEARKLFAEIETADDRKGIACTVLATEDGRHALLWSIPATAHHVGMWLCHKDHATMIGASLPTGVRIDLTEG